MSSAYERARLARVQDNEAFLAALDVEGEKRRAKAPREERKRGLAQKRAEERKRKAEERKQQVRRKSSRLAGEAAPEVFVDRVARGGKITVGGGAPGTLAGDGDQDESSRFEDDVLDLGDDDEHGKAFFASLLKKAKKSAAGDAEKADEKPDLDQEELDYASRLSTLECQEAVKLVQSRGYAVKFHPTQPIICAGDRDGNLGLYRIPAAADDEDDEDAVVQFRPHVSTINVIDYAPADGALLTASYDGTVRRMQLEAPGRFELVFKSEEDHGWLQHAALANEGKSVVLGFSDGLVMCTDTREAESKPSWQFQAHEKKTQTVSMAPDDNYLCTCSLDRSVKIWDVRAVGKASAPKPLAVYTDTNSINSCTFNGRGDQLIAVGQSNFLRLFTNPHQSSEDLEPAHSLRHNNRTGRYLATFHAAWDPQNPSAFICGSMEKPRRVQVFSTEGSKIKRVMNLAGDALTSVQSRNVFHPQENMVACLNASGRLTLFR